MKLCNKEIDYYGNVYSGRLMVVGIILGEGDEISEKCLQKMRSSLIWITTTVEEDEFDCLDVLVLKELICCGYKYRVKSHIIIYNDLLHGEMLTINHREAISTYLLDSSESSTSLDFEFDIN